MAYILEGGMVLVQREKSYRTFVLKKGRKLNLEKLSFYPDNAFGCQFGSSFQVEKQQLVPVSSAGRWKFGGSSESVSGSDNRDIMDDGASQELTEENITEMKGQGASGKEIVDSMIEHSSTFKVRTKFSQEKYIRKKERKYIPVIRILRTTTKLLCEMYHDRAPSKTCFLRSDALAQILSLSNVHAHSNLLVMETTQGLLAGAMLERMGGHGKLVQVFYGDFPVRNILDNFGHLSESDKSILMKYPFHRVGSLLTAEEAQCSSIVRDTLQASKTEGEGQTSRLQLVQAGQRLEDVPETSKVEDSATSVEGVLCKDGEEEGETLPPAKKAKLTTTNDGGVADDTTLLKHVSDSTEPEGTEHAQSDIAMDISLPDERDKNQDRQCGERVERKRAKEEAYKEAEDLLRLRELDGLVIVSRFHPEPVLMSLIHFVAPSRPVVVYCNILEPLVQCYKSLKEYGQTFSIQVSETWTRHYQVLPERTHPEMSMDSRSGYILYTTKIQK